MSDLELNLCDWTKFDCEEKSAKNLVSYYRNTITTAKNQLGQLFDQNTEVTKLVHSHVSFIDKLLIRAWSHYFSDDQSNIALIAVGGYGRGELHLASDIDLLILITKSEQESEINKIESFITFLWDIGLEVGQSVRTLDECVVQAKNDITVVTNLMESRLLCGPEQLLNSLHECTGPNAIWPSKEFYTAKLNEQKQRHLRFGDTAYNLEPNIKENPGGLRDIQVIGWVAKRHFGVTTLHALVENGFITQREYKSLIDSQNFLWRIRYGLHKLSGRCEDRLLFDYQRTLAKQFGYLDSDNGLAVEQFMKQYYRTVLELSRLNEMLLQLFDEFILRTNNENNITRINKRFQIRNDYLETTDPGIFVKYPFALLEIFLVSAQHQNLKGFSAETIRQIRNHSHLIDVSFRQDTRCTSLFMEIFRQPIGLTHELRRMNRYGILAAYLPIFGNIVGQMQHDLFHVYTVDEHTMFLIRNLRRFTVKKYEHEFPLCTKIIKTIPKPELLYLAGFFHDIAKGRSGDHSSLGALDANDFCINHGLSQYDANLVSWLVANHLVMSTTAQRKDISDSYVIQQFAQIVDNQERLNYLYLLTVADIRATSPILWNSWKDSLLAELYFATTRAFRYEIVSISSENQLLNENKSLAQRELLKLGINEDEIIRHWVSLDNDYFIRYSVDEVIWHTQAIIKCNEATLPLILVRTQTHRGGTELFVYTHDDKNVFALITATLASLGLSVTEARISTSKRGFTLDTFIVLETNGEIIGDPHRVEEIKERLLESLANPDLSVYNRNRSTQILSRQQKHFPIETKIYFRTDEPNNRTILEVVAQDQPGLLAKIAMVMVNFNIKLQNAKIATFGAKAEDIFFVTNEEDHILLEEVQEQLRIKITQALTLQNP